MIAWFDRLDRSFMGSEDQVIELPLGWRKIPVNWKGAGNVRGITVNFSAGINQNQLSIP